MVIRACERPRHDKGVDVMLRPRLEMAFSALFTVMTVVTVLWPTWIEGLTGLEPDSGDGSAEWGIVAVLALTALVAGLLARRDYRLAVLRARDAGGPAA
jgi:polyferredoxin